MVPTAPEAPLISTASPAACRPGGSSGAPSGRRSRAPRRPGSSSSRGSRRWQPVRRRLRTPHGSRSRTTREATTLSPGWNRVTSFPTASTWPAVSKPRMGCFGLVRPSFSRIARCSPVGTRRARTRASPELTVRRERLDQHLVVRRRGLGHLFDPHDLRGPVPVADRGLHRPSVTHALLDAAQRLMSASVAYWSMAVELVDGEGEVVQGGEVGLQLGDAARSDDEGGHPRVAERPRQGELGEALAPLLGQSRPAPAPWPVDPR